MSTWLQERIGTHSLTVEVNLVVKVRVVEDLHGDLVFRGVEALELLVLDGDVVLNVLAWEDDLFVATTTNMAHDSPVCNGGRDARDDKEEEVGLDAATVDERKEPLEDVGDTDDECGEVEVAEGAISLCKTKLGGVLDSRLVGGTGRHGVQVKNRKTAIYLFIYPA